MPRSFIIKKSKAGRGWVQVSDTLYTGTSPLSIPANTRTLLPNNAGSTLDLVNYPESQTIWNNNTNSFTPTESGNSYDWRVQFIVDPTLNNRNLTLELDIGGSQGVIWSKTLRLARGAGVDTKITETLDIYTLNTFIQNGGSLYVTCDGDVNLFDIIFKIEEKYRNV